MKLASVHTYIIMAPHKGTRSTPTSSNVSFRAKGPEGENVERIICTPRYISIPELKKPAVVTDRLRRDYGDLKTFDRISMKCGVRKILTSDEVVNAVNAYWSDGYNPNASTSTSYANNEDDSLVSIEKGKKIATKRKYESNTVHENCYDNDCLFYIFSYYILSFVV